MAHDPALRLRARDYYVRDGLGCTWIAERLGVGRATVDRWRSAGGWEAARQHQLDIERESGELVLAMTRRAVESGDPQQAYGAVRAAELAGLAGPRSINPEPTTVARAFIAVLSEHPQLGPLVRRHRDELVDLVAQEAERLETLAR